MIHKARRLGMKAGYTMRNEVLVAYMELPKGIVYWELPETEYLDIPYVTIVDRDKLVTEWIEEIMEEQQGNR
jgi:hypothetical protein